MKLLATNYQQLKTAIYRIDRDTIREHVLFVLNEANFRSLQKRIRWDLFWAVRGSQFIPDTLDDSNIDTALRSVMRDTGIEELVNDVAGSFEQSKTE